MSVAGEDRRVVVDGAAELAGVGADGDLGTGRDKLGGRVKPTRIVVAASSS